MRTFQFMFLAGNVFLWSFSLSAQTESPIQEATYEKSVIQLTVVQQEYDYVNPWKKTQMSRGSGSGFVIAGNRILTNAHNVSNYRYIEVKKQNVAKRYPAKVDFVGHDCDLAIVSVYDPAFYNDMAPLEFGPLPKVNSTVQTCGFPLGGQTVSVTKGVVSRIEVGIYSHTQADTHLLVQTDAAINPGNSGGPVIQDGKVVGVAFQGIQMADNIGFMIPTPVIEHFLKDIEDGVYHGFGSLGILTFEGLHNSALRQYLKVPEDREGVVVLDLVLNSTGASVFQRNDVLTKIGDFDIDNDGMIRIYGLMLDMSEAIEQKQLGETIEVVFYRDGVCNQASVKIDHNEPVLTFRRLFDIQPRYRCFSGLTFVTLNRNFLESWGRNWITDIPFYLRYLFYDVQNLNTNPARKEYVVLSDILPDELTTYVGGFVHQPVESVNGLPILSLDDLDSAFAKDVDGFWVIRFLGNPTPMIIDAVKARQKHLEILEKYDVPITPLPEQSL
ncbi:MAG TPA: trypsin-like peptidase domain-containing protein [Anaerohalosphaeraceae bacterium]|nr:trypsin-like peptidase domain-containing protein [Anaerohalosphaeraceae bacterium]HRU14262.1 trypsin-like peptidase domain-containing protein [Anaerohalosphaeraceae bacterium]